VAEGPAAERNPKEKSAAPATARAAAVAAEGEGEDPEERAGVPVQRAVAAEEARGGDGRAEAAAGGGRARQRGAGGQAEQDLVRDLVGDLAGRLLAFPTAAVDSRLATGAGNGHWAHHLSCCSSACVCKRLAPSPRATGGGARSHRRTACWPFDW